MLKIAKQDKYKRLNIKNNLDVKQFEAAWRDCFLRLPNLAGWEEVV